MLFVWQFVKITTHNITTSYEFCLAEQFPQSYLRVKFRKMLKQVSDWPNQLFH